MQPPDTIWQSVSMVTVGGLWEFNESFARLYHHQLGLSFDPPTRFDRFPFTWPTGAWKKRALGSWSESETYINTFINHFITDGYALTLKTWPCLEGTKVYLKKSQRALPCLVITLRMAIQNTVPTEKQRKTASTSTFQSLIGFRSTAWTVCCETSLPVWLWAWWSFLRG